ncbi:transcriptional regulator [Tenacibaculum soleae]|uniref:Transcriptional regulator n=1 Tax=Tenacibaculum soleae TaxID=447689 RepID=A0A1B9Y312_9FLAO|nr:helix-turn-helix transcriptional regulator [Tenacibaculum soleae]OCK44190.1 transcriptional regulator [Tenacibaculum soleae]
MTKKISIILPKLERLLEEMGEQIKLARLRRKLSTEQVSERSGVSRKTLYSVEKGKSSVSIGIYIKVLNVLGLEKDILQVGKDDVLGRKLQDIGLRTKERAPKRK